MNQGDWQCVGGTFRRHRPSLRGRPIVRYRRRTRIYRHFNPIRWLAEKVAKVFPCSWLILAKGLRAVNGKSVPFAHYRKPIGYPEKTTPPKSVLVSHRY